MNANRLLGLVGAFVVMFGLGGLWHQLLMADHYATVLPSVTRAEPNLVVIGCGYLITAAVMAVVFPIGYKGGSGGAEGLRFGAVIGLLWWLPSNIVLSGVFETTLTSALIDGVWHIVEGAAGGIVIGLLHVRGGAA